jgi:cold shock CspA family protein
MAENQERRIGQVTVFDAYAGLGEIRDNQGESWPFHCVSLSDGSRSVAVGAQVSFTIRFHVKRDEAFDIEIIEAV